MLPGPMKAYLRRRKLVRLRADRLIATYGDKSWSVARAHAHAIDPFEDRARADLAWQVVGIVERRLRISWQPDTATRWLESR